MFQYRMTILSVLIATIKIGAKAMAPQMFNASISCAGMVCAEKLDHIYRSVLELTWNSFSIQPFERFIYILICIICFSFIILLFEIFHNQIKKSPQISETEKSFECLFEYRK